MAPLAPARLRLSSLVFAVVTARRAVHEHRAIEAALDVSAEDHTASALQLTSDQSVICGGTQIWNLLTVGITEADEVMNIQWGQIEALKTKQVDDKKTEKQQCQHELEDLQARLKAKEGKDLPRSTEEQHLQMIEAGLSIFPSDPGAVAFGCGLTRRYKSPAGKRMTLSTRDPYEDSIAAFETAAREFFGKKEARLDGDAFSTICHTKLQVDEAATEDESYCKPICLSFRAAAQKASNEFVGAAAVGIDELKDKIKEKEQCISAAKRELDICESDWNTLAVFRDELAAHSKEVTDRFAAVRAARMALYDAESQMDDIMDNLEAQEQALEMAIAALDAAGSEEDAAKDALKAAQAKEKDLKEKVDAAGSELERLTVELKNAERAGTKAITLKEKVEVIMQLMDEFADAALREPVRMIGFEDFVDNLVFPDHLTSQVAGDTQSQVAAVREQCDKAAPAFEALKKSSDIDLFPLCSFKETPVVFKDLAEQVALRRNLVRQDMEKVMAWLTPYKFHKALTFKEFEEAVAEESGLVAQGQAANLEKAKSVYVGGSSFFKYLIKWRLNGQFMGLNAKLQALADALATSVAAAKKDLAALEEELLAAQKALQAALATLEEATKKVSSTSAEKAKLDQAVEELRAQEDKMNANLDELQKALAKAMKLHREAQAVLFAAHQEGTEQAFVQVADKHAEQLRNS